MSNKVFVGGISWGTTDDTLKAAFAPCGEVTSARVITDRETGKSRGFGFVEFADANSADEAIATMHDTELDGRRLRVDRAEEKKGGGGNRGGGGGDNRRRGGGGKGRGRDRDSRGQR